jgi:hemerythrin-like domain-containing protein
MQDRIAPKESRRNFLVKSGMLIGIAGLFGPAGCTRPEPEAKAWEVAPTEDLMREHGVLQRLMLIYDEIGNRLKQGQEFPLPVLGDANELIRRFMQEYHELNEQFHVFNRFSNAGKFVELVAVLYQQHLAGRRLIDKVQSMSTADHLQNPAERLKVAAYLHLFNQTYRHHAAWEDTVLFPAFRSVISPKDFAALGVTFAKEEQKRFGPNGFEKIVAQVADLEKKLSIYDLQQFILTL